MYGQVLLQPQTVRALGASWKLRPLEVIVPAATGINAPGKASPQLEISGGFHYFSEWLNTVYPTVLTVDDVLTDDGVCRLRDYIAAGTADLGLTAGSVLLESIAIPGRRRTPAVNGDPAQAPAIPGYPFPCFVTSGNGWYHELENESNVAAKVDFTLGGWDIPVSRVPDADAFWRIVSDCQSLSPMPR